MQLVEFDFIFSEGDIFVPDIAAMCNSPSFQMKIWQIHWHFDCPMRMHLHEVAAVGIDACLILLDIPRGEHLKRRLELYFVFVPHQPRTYLFTIKKPILEKQWKIIEDRVSKHGLAADESNATQQNQADFKVLIRIIQKWRER